MKGDTARRAIVTGSESGIGRATAVALARNGCDIGVTWHRDEQAGRHVQAEIERLGRRAVLRRLEQADVAAAIAVVEELAHALGGLDVFVANAAVNERAAALDTTEAGFRRILDVDLIGAFFTMQAAARVMVAAGRGGRIVAVTSVHDRSPLRDAAAYTAAKHGLLGLTRSLALELAPHGITVNAVAPGEVATRATNAEGVDPGSLKRPAIPLGRPGGPREIAAAVAHLASPEAGYTTGASLVVDGGMLLTPSATGPGRALIPGRAARIWRRLVR